MTMSENVRQAAVQGAIGVVVRVTITMKTVEAASELRAALPKSIRVAGRDDWLYLYVQLWADGANGGTNEAGVKRLRSLIKNLAKQGITLEHTGRADNEITPAQLAELIA